MRALVVGVNHRTAPVELREKLAIPADRCPEVLRDVKEAFPKCEALILSTCNRVELCLARELHAPPRVNEALMWMAGRHHLPSDQLLQALYHHEGEAAVRHVFRVVSSLDSLVVGEAQILGQAKEALQIAQDAGATGAFLMTLFERAFSAAKQVRTESSIAEGRTSVGSVAVEFVNQIFDSLENKTVLVIGAGKMGRLTLRHLANRHPREILVSNRTASRARAIAEEVNGRVVDYANMRDNLADADVVITSVDSDDPILTRETFDGVLEARRYRPLLIIDIAVPRNVDPAVGELENVYVYNVDDLEAAVRETVVTREQEFARCEEMLETHVREFFAWQGMRKVGPTVKAFRARLDELADAELEWVMGKLEGADERHKQLVRQCLHRLVGKVAHGPASKLRQGAQDGAAHVRANSLAELFDLPEVEE